MVAGMTALSQIYPVYEAEFEKKAVVVRGGPKNAKRAFSDKLVHDSRWKGLLDHSRKEAARRAKSDKPGSRAAGRAISSMADRGVPLGGAAAALRNAPGFKGAMAESDKIALATRGGMGDVGALGASTVARGGAGTPGARLEGAVRDPAGTVKGAVGRAKKKLKARKQRRAQQRGIAEVRNAAGKSKHLSPDEYNEFVRTGGVKRIQPDPSAARGNVRAFDNPYGVKKSHKFEEGNVVMRRERLEFNIAKSVEGLAVEYGVPVSKDNVWHWEGPKGDDAGKRRFKRKQTWPSKGKKDIKRARGRDEDRERSEGLPKRTDHERYHSDNVRYG